MLDQVLLADFKRVMKQRSSSAWPQLLVQPEGRVNEVIYPVVGEHILQDLVVESRPPGRSYSERVHRVVRGGLYSHHYRRMVPRLPFALEFATTNAPHSTRARGAGT